MQDHEPALRPCSQEGQWHPGVYLKDTNKATNWRQPAEHQGLWLLLTQAETPVRLGPLSARLAAGIYLTARRPVVTAGSLPLSLERGGTGAEQAVQGFAQPVGKPTKEGGATASTPPLTHPNNVSFHPCGTSPILSHCTCQWGAQLQPVSHLLAGTGWLLQGPSEPSLLQAEQNPSSPRPPRWPPNPYRSSTPRLPRNLDTSIPVKFTGTKQHSLPTISSGYTPTGTTQKPSDPHSPQYTLPFFLLSSETPPTRPLPALFSQSKARANRRAHLGSFGHPHHGHYRRSEP